MPKLTPKQIQGELDQDQLWPVYWLYGLETMKIRELLKRIRSAVGANTLSEETLDGTEVSASAILDSAQGLAFGGGPRLTLIRNAHAIKNSDTLAPLLGPKGSKADLPFVTVFLSKDLDGRKKFSKLLTKNAAVVPCEAVPDTDRERWIDYLASRRSLSLPPHVTAQLRSLDPWSLDIIDQELEKYSLALLNQNADESSSVLQGNIGVLGGTELFLEAFFNKNKKQAISLIEHFAFRPEESIPLLGLMAWNVRQLAMLIADRESGARTVKLNPYLADRFRRWSNAWSQDQIATLQSDLTDLDFGLKQTRKHPLGLWANLVHENCA